MFLRSYERANKFEFDLSFLAAKKKTNVEEKLQPMRQCLASSLSGPDYYGKRAS